MGTLSDDLAQLASLRDKGVLSEAEFAAQKERFLHGDAAPAAAPVTPSANAPVGVPPQGKTVGGYAILAAGAAGVLLLLLAILRVLGIR